MDKNHDEAQLLLSAVTHSVDAKLYEISGQQTLRITLDERARSGVYGVAYVDMPTFLVLPTLFTNGEISVQILSRLLPDAPDYARGFAGLAYRISEQADQFEAVYVRPLNGRALNPPSPRQNRAVQYFVYPDWKFERLRQEFPEGRFEAGADILPEQWLHLNVAAQERYVRVSIDGTVVLELDEAPVAPNSGRIGLWVDIGTEAFFRELAIST